VALGVWHIDYLPFGSGKHVQCPRASRHPLTTGFDQTLERCVVVPGLVVKQRQLSGLRCECNIYGILDRAVSPSKTLLVFGQAVLGVMDDQIGASQEGPMPLLLTVR